MPKHNYSNESKLKLKIKIRKNPKYNFVKKKKKLYFQGCNSILTLYIKNENGKTIKVLEKKHNPNSPRESLIQIKNGDIGIGTKLNEKGIGPKIHYYNEDCNSLVMDFLNGYELFQILNNSLSRRIKKITFENIMNFIWQISGKLKLVHDSEIIYRDLKLENIILKCNGELKLIDFGLACEFNSKKNGIVGTLGYCCPDILNNDYNNSVDWWSCGIILWVLLTNNFPFHSSSKNCANYLIELINTKKKPTLYLNQKYKEQLCLNPIEGINIKYFGEFDINSYVNNNIKPMEVDINCTIDQFRSVSNLILGLLNYNSEERYNYNDIFNYFHSFNLQKSRFIFSMIVDTKIIFQNKNSYGNSMIIIIKFNEDISIKEGNLKKPIIPLTLHCGNYFFEKEAKYLGYKNNEIYFKYIIDINFNCRFHQKFKDYTIIDPDKTIISKKTKENVHLDVLYNQISGNILETVPTIRIIPN